MAQYRQEHPEAAAAYRAANRDRIHAYNKEWRAAHVEHRRKQHAEYHAAHRDEGARYEAEWKMRNPEAQKAKAQRGTATRRARQRNAFVEQVDVRVLAERDRDRCGICGKHVMVTDRSVDHILPLANGGLHSYANTQLAHLRCNVRRQNTGTAQLRMIG